MFNKSDEEKLAILVERATKCSVTQIMELEAGYQSIPNPGDDCSWVRPYVKVKFREL